MAFTEADITAIVLWQLVVYVVFTLSYVPIWLSRWYLAWDPKGWQFRVGPNAPAAMRVKLLYPPVWFSGPVWWLLYSLAGFSAWHAVRSTKPGQTLDAIFIVFMVFMWIQGTFTIWFWYYGLPFWSILHLGLASILGIAYTILTVVGPPTLTSLWLVLPIVMADWVIWPVNLYLFLAHTERYIGNPIEAFIARGFNPIRSVYHYEEFHRDRHNPIVDASGLRRRHK